MMARWPDELPRPKRDGYGSQAQDARARRTVRAGPPLRRRMFSAAARMVNFTLVLDPDQALRFDHFVHVTLKAGTQPFRMAHPDRDGRPLMTADGVPLLTEDDSPLLVACERTWVFGDEMPVEGPLKGHLRDVSFTLAEMP